MLYIIAVYDSDDSLIVKSCGTTPPDLVISSSNSLKTVFKSDNARHYEGFKVSWTTTQNINSIKSPNYPLPYHNDANEVSYTFSLKTRRKVFKVSIYSNHTNLYLLKTWTLGPVAEGERIRLTFLHFDIEDHSECSSDWLEIDSGGRISKHCGRIRKPWIFISNSNIMVIRLISDNIVRRSGFLAIWTTTSEPPTYPTSPKCDSCVFPFHYGDETFDTCISILGVDDQPWCTSDSGLPPPVDEGTHIFPTLRITCSDDDSSCPSTPPQFLLISPEYPQYYPNNADMVRCYDSILFLYTYLYLCRLGHC